MADWQITWVTIPADTAQEPKPGSIVRAVDSTLWVNSPDVPGNWLSLDGNGTAWEGVCEDEPLQLLHNVVQPAAVQQDGES